MSTFPLKVIRSGLLVSLVLVGAMIGVRSALNLPESRFDTLLALVVSTLASGACVVDSRILQRPIVFIGQAALFFLWPIAVPAYLIWSRGCRGILALVIWIAILAGSVILGGLVAAFSTK